MGGMPIISFKNLYFFQIDDGDKETDIYLSPYNVTQTYIAKYRAKESSGEFKVKLFYLFFFSLIIRMTIFYQEP